MPTLSLADLHGQIAATFVACGLPNPLAVDQIRRPRDKDGKPVHPAPGKPDKVYMEEQIVAGVSGKSVLSTIFKFAPDDPALKSPSKAVREAAVKKLAVADSERWIVLVDEAHRTQEEDLGAYLRAVLPQAVRFGFTGTPVKKNDKDTFTNFGAPGETYLDKYGIDDAVADGATVLIYHQARLTEWHLDAAKLDALFDQWFAHEPPALVEQIKARGVTRGDLARFPPRIALIATDIWAHYRAHVMPDGFKAQICAIDREACVAYKLALDAAIANSLVSDGVDPDEAALRAEEMSLCIYSPGQNDGVLNPDLVKHQQSPEKVTPEIVPRFLDPNDPLRFLIVCNKLLTGFDAPIEQALYLDNPLTDHSLLQAIARTNRRCGPQKDRGLVVNYIGVGRDLAASLSAYRADDVKGALRDEDELHDKLRAAHQTVMTLVPGLAPPASMKASEVAPAVAAVLDHFRVEDKWYVLRAAIDGFLRAYAALAPNARVLAYTLDMKFMAAVLAKGRAEIEGKVDLDYKTYSAKIRQMLAEHLEVTGLKTACKLRSLSDPAFCVDFDSPADVKTAAIHKMAELKKITSEFCETNAAQYERFSDRVKEVIAQFNAGILGATKMLEEAEQIAQGIAAEQKAHEGSGLTPRAYGLAKVLAKFKPKAEGPAGGGAAQPKAGGDSEPGALSPLEAAAAEIDALYASDATAPTWRQEKSVLKQELRGQVRRLVQPLGLDGWQKEIPQEVEAFAVIHYRKP